jgi:hypothetical protein
MMLEGICDMLHRILALGFGKRVCQEPARDGELQFSQVGVHLSYGFDLGCFVNPIDAARRLLKSDFAVGFRNYAAGKQEVSDACYVEAEREGEHYSTATTEVDEGQEGLFKVLEWQEVQTRIDREIFDNDYLEETPFARISLRPFEATFANESIVFNVVVTVHRSGIAVLGVDGVLSHPLRVHEIVRLHYMPLLPIHNCRVASVVNSYLSRDKQVTLDDLLDAYSRLIVEKVQGKRYRARNSLNRSLRSLWVARYPIIFVRCSEVETSEDFRALYAEPLARLVLGFLGPSKLNWIKVKETYEDDLSFVDDHSLYLTEGYAIGIQYGSIGHDTPVRFRDTERALWVLQTTTVIDILILQRMLLAVYAERIEQVTLDASGLVRLNKIRQEMLLALDEYEVLGLLGLSRYGSVVEVLQHGQEKLRVKDMHTLFSQRLDHIERLVQVVESKRRAARDWALKIVTTIVSLVLSLPAAHSFVDTVAGWSPALSGSYPPWIRVPFTWLVESAQNRPTFWTIVLYAVIVAVTMFAFWSGTVATWLRKQRAVPIPETTKSQVGRLFPMSFGELADLMGVTKAELQDIRRQSGKGSGEQK